MTHTVLEVRHCYLTWPSSETWVHSAQGFSGSGAGDGMEGCWRPVVTGWWTDYNWPEAAVETRPTTAVQLVFGVDFVNRSRPPSATLDVLFDDDTTVSEERARQRLQECPSVGTRVKRFHISQDWTLAAYGASCGIDLPIQNHSTAQKQNVWFRQLSIKSEAIMSGWTEPNTVPSDVSGPTL